MGCAELQPCTRVGVRVLVRVRVRVEAPFESLPLPNSSLSDMGQNQWETSTKAKNWWQIPSSAAKLPEEFLIAFRETPIRRLNTFSIVI